VIPATEGTHGDEPGTSGPHHEPSRSPLLEKLVSVGVLAVTLIGGWALAALGD